MSKPSANTSAQAAWPWAAYDYLVDRSQRTILFWDVLRKRGNTYLDHLHAGQPPVLVFDYDMVMDGRNFTRPVNYALVRIKDRRVGQRGQGPQNGERRRQATSNGKHLDSDGRPSRAVVVIDPRAGHGPGIGGSKLNSQIGVALDHGHPVYFILFFTDPEPGQTISLVQEAEVRFLKEVCRLHPDAPRPAVIGNCQAGWATALIGADRPDLTGPMILNGSPLSYWGGVEGANPMRYKGGLLGGVWLTSLWCDLGNGIFDGANLVSGFEDLNPANTLWTKYYHLFAHIDTEEDRFLNFEKWWGGFFKMNSEEIHFIVDSLFVGNELEQGNLSLGNGKFINLKHFKDPILVFASKGDNITPPAQAFNWIYKVYGTVDEIRRCGQVIIYMQHRDVGHLGIFVSGKVARKEHSQILGNLGWLEYLQPGLYEMVIDQDPADTAYDDYQVRFEERTMDDLLRLDDGLEDEKAFVPVHRLSRMNDALYSFAVRPWLQPLVTEPVAEQIRQVHPLRMQRYMFSDRNPGCWPVKWCAGKVAEGRRTVTPDNPYVIMEGFFSDILKIGLNSFRDSRDMAQEQLFKIMYGNTIVEQLHEEHQPEPGGYEEQNEEERKKQRFREQARLRRLAVKGGFVEAAVRTMIAVAGANRVMDTREFRAAEQIIQASSRLQNLGPETYKKIVRTQANILEGVPRKAITALAEMELTKADVKEILGIADAVAAADGTVGKRQQTMLQGIRRTLNNKKTVKKKG